MVDLTLGDPGFDAVFRVEVAPADVARELLDPELRKLLASYPASDLYTVDGEHGVRILRPGGGVDGSRTWPKLDGRWR